MLPPPRPTWLDRFRVARLLTKETLRALLFPLRMLAFLPRSRQAQAAAKRLLTDNAAGEDSPPVRPLAARPLPTDRKLRIFVSTGDVSGETHALSLKQTLDSQGVEADWYGLGGKRLAAAGVEILADLTSKPVMGFGPVVSRIPFFCGVVAKTLALFRRLPPDLVILVDSPALNILLGIEAKRLRVPTLYYICPQLWGWAPWRLARFRRATDAALCIFPFEPIFFRDHGVHSAWAGHPVADTLAASPPKPDLVADFRRTPTLGLLPGSRPSDIKKHLPPMLAAVQKMRDEGIEFRTIIAQEDPQRVALIEELLGQSPAGGGVETTPHLRELTTGARLVLVKSGTSSLETALTGTPNLICYVLESSLVRKAAKRFLAVPYFGAANLIAAQRIVPELLLIPGEEETLASATLELWNDEQRLQAMRKALEKVQALTLKPGAAGVAANWVKALLET